MMSDTIKHECGIALIRMLKPLSYYIEKYGTPLYGLNKLYLLMEKQRNRGQDGAGVASIKFNQIPGKKYIDRLRSSSSNAIAEIFKEIQQGFQEAYQLENTNLQDATFLKQNVPFAAELLMGHLRYATHGMNGTEFCHPRIRSNNWRNRNLVVAGNFNMTNNEELFELLMDLGQHPKDKTDTVTVLEKMGHFLDVVNQELFEKYKSQGIANKTISNLIAEHIDPADVLRRAAKDFDGGFAIAGMMGHGDAFILRDANGIRPAFYYQDEEFLVAASERPAIQTAFATKWHEIQEIKPGHAIIIKQNGKISHEQILAPQEKLACSFERIYFSRGTDRDIYQERKKLGNLISPIVLKAIDYDLKNTVFSYIPNTAETAFLGLTEGLNKYLNQNKKEQILSSKNLSDEQLGEILNFSPRVEKITVKDAKLRTFITADSERSELVSHVYDTTYGVVRRNLDTLVIVDDSIVRGTTLKKSILGILDRLGPKKIIVVSSAPQIRYPDCYGIDMSKLKDFVAFRAVIELLDGNSLIKEVYDKCKKQELLPRNEVHNFVKELYDSFTAEEISNKIAEIIKPINAQAKIEVIFQSIENLHEACPNHLGDWYFTGNFPTPGGNKVVNKAFINYYEGVDARSY